MCDCDCTYLDALKEEAAKTETINKAWAEHLRATQKTIDEIISGAFYAHFGLSLEHPESLAFPETLFMVRKDGAPVEYHYSYRGETFLIEREELEEFDSHSGVLKVTQRRSFRRV